MIATNYSTARDKFKEYCDMATRDFETIIITRKQGENVVLMSEAEYNNIMENLFIIGNKKNYDHILKGVEQLNRGQCQIKELINTDE